jgi:predicted phage terminase large subunit-like protein
LPRSIETAIRTERARRRINRREAGSIDQIRERCKSLAQFVKEAWPVLLPDTPYVHGWHIDVICAHLEAITFGRFLARGLDNRLLMNVPPGTMKSLLVCVFWPAWEWGPCDMPHLQYIATSFRVDFCVRDSSRFRKLVASDWYQRRWPTKLVKQNEDLVENDRGGKREAIPFGSLTGGRADRLLIDDPHSIDTAESDVDRERAEMRFRESATFRLNEPVRSAIIVIMQRLHEKDISGVILRLKLRYVHVMLPMRFEPERACVTPFGTDRRTIEGELLFPERFPPEVVDRDEAASTAHAVASQQQQRPGPRGGLTFKRHWFKIVPAAPAFCRRVRGWDLAATEKKRSPYTCGVRLAYDQRARHYYIEHVARDRVSNPETMIVNTASLDGTDVEISIPQDPGQSGKVQAKAIIAALSGYVAFSSPESGDKEARAKPVAAQAEVGNMSIVAGDWNDAFLDEIESFPTGQFKDQVDALSRAFSQFVGSPDVPMAVPLYIGTPRDTPGQQYLPFVIPGQTPDRL